MITHSKHETSRFRSWTWIVSLAVASMAVILSGCGTTRTLSITTDPDGATIKVDGVDAGTTAGGVPVTRTVKWLEEGDSHTVEAMLREYEPVTRDLDHAQAVGSRDPWRLLLELERIAHKVQVMIETKPEGGRLRVNGSALAGAAPGSFFFPFERRSSTSPWCSFSVEAILPGYFSATKELTYTKATEEGTLSFQLEKSTETIDVAIKTNPPGARITLLGGKPQKGQTPLSVPLLFRRESPDSPWQAVTFTAELEDFAPETVTLTYEQVCDNPSAEVELTRIRDVVPVLVSCNEAEADVYIGNEAVGQTDLQHSFKFTRTKDGEWSSFAIKVSKDGYRYRPEGVKLPPGDQSPFVTRLTYDDAKAGSLHVPLEPIRFVWTIFQPLEFKGDQLGIAEQRVLAQVGEAEREPLAQSVTRVTDWPAGTLMDTRLWVVGQENDILYSVPFARADRKDTMSNLWLQRGQGKVRLTDGPFLDIHASVSSDGSYAYFSSNRLRPDKLNIWRVEMSGQGGFTKITDSPSSVADWQPELSPDGSALAYASKLRGSEVWFIWVANSNGTLPTQLREGHNPAWAPSGKRLVYVAKDDDGFDQIWVMDSRGGSPTQLTSAKAHHQHPVWTPDGSAIVYASNQAVNAEGLNNFDIWRMNADGTDRTQLTVNGSWDNRPAVSADGRYIYFLSNRGARVEASTWQIRRFELKTGAMQ
jgi:hypothetical protein